MGRGYWFFVTGQIPVDKDPAAVDRKLIERYRGDISRWSRLRRKRAGIASVQYLRHGRFCDVEYNDVNGRDATRMQTLTHG